jgi:hypothetical protein
MRYEAVRNGDIPEGDLLLYDRAIEVVDKIDDEDMTCHVLARVVAKELKDLAKSDVVHVDGYFCRPCWRHSWVVLPTGNILDVYPIGGCMPMLVTVGCGTIVLPWSDMYVHKRLSFKLEPTGHPNQMAAKCLKHLKKGWKERVTR